MSITTSRGFPAAPARWAGGVGAGPVARQSPNNRSPSVRAVAGSMPPVTTSVASSGRHQRACASASSPGVIAAMLAGVGTAP